MARNSRPVWEGHLRLSLVTCPVALFKATTEGHGIHFHLLHPQTHNRVKQAWKDTSLPDGEQEVERSDLVHGYEVEKGKYVIIDDADIGALKIESSKTIQIERFVDAAEIDRLYWDVPYYLVPIGKPELMEPFGVIRAALEAAGRVAIGRVVMGGRERIVAIEGRGRGLLMSTLHTANEIRSDADLFDRIPTEKVDGQMVEIAQAIIGKQEGAFDPRTFNDRYADALRQLVADKSAGAVVDRTEERNDSNVVDLMDALRRSLAGSGTPGAAEKKPAPKATSGKRRSAKRA